MEKVLMKGNEALAEAAKTDDALAVRGGKRGIDAAEQKRVREARREERLSDDARPEALEIDDDVG